MKNKIREIGWSLYGQHAWDQNQNHEVAEAVCARIISILTENRICTFERVLDAGCGTGYYAAKIHDAGFQVTAVDYAKGMIKKARSKFAAKKMLQFERADLAKVLPYQDATFDHIVSVSVLQSVPDPVFTLQEFRRILKSEGIVIITHSPKPDTHHIPLKPHVGRQSGHASKKNFLSMILPYVKSYAERSGFSKYWSQDELEEIFMRSNLTIVKTEIVHSIFISTLLGSRQGVNTK